METGLRGTFVISWSQADIDGLNAAPLEALSAGATWSWRGEPVRVDGPNDCQRNGNSAENVGIRKRAARKVRRLVGAAVQNTPDIETVDIREPLMDSCFVVTNGVQSFSVTIIEVGAGMPPLLMFVDELPPRDKDLWIVHRSLGPTFRAQDEPSQSGVICFTPGTRIGTPEGPRPIEDLRIGDKVQTRDSGAQDILWIGSRRMTGARLFALPALRPIRISAGALGIERPDQELLVSPDHRMLVRGRAARALFNTPEVLVRAGDLVNGGSVRTDVSVREVTYVHLLLSNHQIIWANGVETESFHPASAALDTLCDADRQQLLSQFPELECDPFEYGEFARRNLSPPEAAILRHEVA